MGLDKWKAAAHTNMLLACGWQSEKIWRLL